MTEEEIVKLLRENGCRAVFVPFHHVEEAKEEIRGLRRDGKVDADFYDEWMPTYLDAKPPASMQSPKSILLVATPTPQRKVEFSYRGKAHAFVVPPTYGTGPPIARRIRRILRNGGRKSLPRLVVAHPPLKLLAVRSGLAYYGRNNVTYVQGIGSFHRLTAFYSDLEVPEGDWGEKRMLPECEKCRACMYACPTGAIMKDRFLLRAERCLSFLNERTSEREFPSWVRPEWHNAIIGCMECQRACPRNRDALGDVLDAVSFSEEETEYLLNGKYSGKRAAAIERKLRRAGLDLSVFPRNLEALLRKSCAR